MDNRPVLFIDSGIGGLPYCKDFIKRNPHEAVFYIADRENFPYGCRTKENLINILTSLMETAEEKINPKVTILACNTATVSAIGCLRGRFPHILFVGTVPAIKPAAETSKTGIVGLLGTARTIEEPYKKILEDNYCEMIGIAAPDMVEFIERHFDTAKKEEKYGIVRKYTDFFRGKGADTIVLGCTHFLYLLQEFKHEAAPDIKIFNSLDGITKRIEFLLDENMGKLRIENGSAPARRILLTGKEPPDSVWQKRSSALGFSLDLFCDI